MQQNNRKILEQVPTVAIWTITMICLTLTAITAAEKRTLMLDST